jgi:hypothetical protein
MPAVLRAYPDWVKEAITRYTLRYRFQGYVGVRVMELELGALIGGLATAAAAGVGLVLTARQIRLARESDERNYAWRRIDFVRSVVDKLNEDEEVQFCLRALDWGVGPIQVPSKHRALFEDRREVMTHDAGTMERALQVELAQDFDSTREILVYRLSFDHFFTVVTNVLTYGDRLGDEFMEDVGLSYYTDLIRSPPYMSHPRTSPLFGFVKTFYPELCALIWGKSDCNAA